MRRFNKKVVILVIMAMVLNMILGFAQVPSEIPVPELRGMTIEDGDSEALDAYDKGYPLYKNTYFLDTQKSIFARDVSRLGALGIIHKENDINFHPEEVMTKQKYLEHMVRLIGQEAQVIEDTFTQGAGFNQEALQRLSQGLYIDAAINAGILTAAESRNLLEPITKEVAALWLSRALALDPTFQNAENLYSFGDWQDILPEARGLIETLISDQLMSVDGDGNFNPKRSLTKGEVAEILNNAVDGEFENLGVEEQVGLVIGKSKETETITGGTIEREFFTVRNLDGTLSTLTTSKNNKTGDRNEFVLYKNGVTTISKYLEVGHQISYLIRDEDVFFAEILEDGSIQEQIKNMNAEGGNGVLYYGVINERIKEEKWSGPDYLEIDRLRTTTYNGQIFDIVVEENFTTNIKNDIIVYKNGKIGGVDLLEPGDVLEMLVEDEARIIYVKVNPPTQDEVSGTVRFVDTDPETGMTLLTVFDYNNNIKKYELAPYAHIEINHDTGAVSDLKYGQDVKLFITNGYVIKVTGETFLNPGFIPDYSKMRTGTVLNVTSLNNVKVKYPTGQTEIIQVPDNATLLKGGNIISVQALQEGDKVKLYFNDIYSKNVSLIEIEGKEQLIQNIYRGLVQDVNVYRNQVTLVEPAILNNAQWKGDEEAYTKTFDVPKDIPIYVRGEAIDLETLSKLYKNYPVYIAVRDDYSEESVVQLSVALGGEHFAVDRVNYLDRVIGQLELQDNNRNVVFNEGTIFVKNSKLVDSSALKNLDDVVMVSDYYRGQNNANIVRITSDAERIFDQIHVGAVENVYGYAFNLRNYGTISGNQWSDINRSNSALFFYFNELDIVDITDKTDFETLSSYEFFHGGYSREENKVTNAPGLDYHRYYTFFVTDDERKVIGMNIRKYGLVDGQNIDMFTNDESDIKEELDDVLGTTVLSRGTIVSFDQTWKRIEMTDSHDWADDFGRWNANRGNSSVEYRDAIIIKNNKRIEIEDLKQGDYIYVLRDDEDALVIFVEER
jgi:hypothetical protein